MNMNATRAIRLVDPGGEPRTAVRVAIATGGSGLVDASLGRTTRLAIYEVAADESRLVELVEFPPMPRKCFAANDNPEECEGLVAVRMAAIDACHLVFARRIGDIAATSAMKRGIHPIAVPRDEPITALLARCQAMLATNPPPWLRKAIGAAAQLPTRPERTEAAGIVRDGAISASNGGTR